MKRVYFAEIIRKPIPSLYCALHGRIRRGLCFRFNPLHPHYQPTETLRLRPPRLGDHFFFQSPAMAKQTNLYVS